MAEWVMVVLCSVVVELRGGLWFSGAVIEECEGGDQEFGEEWSVVELAMAASMELGSDMDLRNATLPIADEDHTFGNSLRFVLNREPRVAFCGYSFPPV